MQTLKSVYTKNTQKALTRLTLTLFFLVVFAAGVFLFIYLKSQNIDTEELFTIAGAKKLILNEVGDGLKVISKNNPAAEKLKNKFESAVGANGNNSEELNSKEFSAKSEDMNNYSSTGPKVPAGSSSTNTRATNGSRKLEIIFQNDDVLTGEFLTEKIFLDTEHGPISFNTRDILSIASVKEANPPYDKITTKNGDKITGTLKDKSIKIKSSSGDTISIKISKVKIIEQNF